MLIRGWWKGAGVCTMAKFSSGGSVDLESELDGSGGITISDAVVEDGGSA